MSTQPSGGDLTPIAGSQTDVAPLGRSGPPPAHEQTADIETVELWQRISEHPDFIALKRAKVRFIVPATAFFVIYYFILPISVGWYPKFMQQEVLGRVNLAYLFAFSQFIMAWVLAALYVKTAAGWDRRSEALLRQLEIR